MPAPVVSRIAYDVGVGEALPYDGESFDAVVCVDVLEHVTDLNTVLLAGRARAAPGRAFSSTTPSTAMPLSRLVTITLAEDILRLLPRGTHDPAMFIRPHELRRAAHAAGLVHGPMTGLGPRGVNRRLDFTFGPMPLTTVIYMGVARKRPAEEGASSA